MIFHVPRTDLSTAVPVVDLNGVDDGVTTFADQTGFNVPDKMDIKGNQSGSILVDASDINCADRSKEIVSEMTKASVL